MDHTLLNTHLVTEAAKLKAAFATAAPDVKVPTCPDWTAADLIDHVTETYDHKIQSMRLMRAPGEDFRIDRPGGPAAQFDGALADLIAEFASRGPESLSYTWYGPDQSVGFWIRRMAQETVIHRADAELAAGQPISPVDDALALDGIDEMLTVMLTWGSRAFRDSVADEIAANNGLEVALQAGTQSWTIQVDPEGVSAVEGVTAAAQATLTGTPDEVLLWLWRRLPVDALDVKGHRTKPEALYDLIGAFAQ
ncbi:MAG TPA: maleylpyruvate isomerase family mycothiol-dependent enzyme [Glycomyces sp.]|nr:maleylpyruvate isomerase family mycothiol-dependent enzyme [Glycomyces sp.]